MTHSRVASRYAAALMQAAEEAKAVDAVARDLEVVRATLGGSWDLQRLLASPIVSSAKKQSILTELFGARFAPLTMQFVALMVDKGRERALASAVEQWFGLRDERMGVVTADVTSAVDLTPDQRRAITATLERATGKTVRVRTFTDAAVRAGLIVRLGDTVHDGSLRRQLERLRERLVSGPVDVQ